MFQAYTISHLAPLLIASLIGWIWIRWAKKLPPTKQRTVGFVPSLILPFLMLFDIMMYIALGSFDVKLHLPLYMCRLVTFAIPYMIWIKHRGLFGVLYFWVLAGTTQAIITPDIASEFPSYEYVRYWLLHSGLILTIVYTQQVYNFIPTWKDLWIAVIAAQVYLILTFPINWALNSNYGYTMEKPPMGSIADLMGPWPWYLLTGELLMIALFVLLYLPFGIRKRDSNSEHG